MFAFRRFVLRRQVVVNLDDGSAVQGVLFAKSGPLLVVKNATVLEPKAEPVKVDGDVVIERSKVAYIQAL